MKPYALHGFAFWVSALLVTGTGIAVAADAASQEAVAHGKQLHNSACLSCHDTSVYTRPDRRIHSLAALRSQVHSCQQGAGAGWSESDRQDVIQYLNQTFYHFKPGGSHG